MGKKYSNTVGVVDLGGGSVQMAYAISDADAAKAPKISNGEESYVREMFLKGTRYYLYVHRSLSLSLSHSNTIVFVTSPEPFIAARLLHMAYFITLTELLFVD